MKSSYLYRLILLLWLALMAASVSTFAGQITEAAGHGPLILSLMVICITFICYFWLNGMKDIVYTLFFQGHKAELLAGPARYLNGTPLVALVYCTYNDFDEASLLASMQQNYSNFKTVILDDSTSRQVRQQINRFGDKYGVQIVRRRGHEGFKAGNLNHYLKRAKYDYFVILDSDEIIPPNFISRSLDYFAADPQVGIVQANHIATRNRNDFMHQFSQGVDSHWPVYQSIKARYGFLSLLGHGAMVSKTAYQAAGGFPHVVAEDLCFSIRVRDAGFLVAFAADIICQEEYPVDYLAFKKRHSKWTQGNMEFIKRFTGEIIRSRMTWFEKLDIVLFTYSLPLTSIFFLYLIINVVIFPAMGFDPDFPLLMVIPTVIFLLAPMLNDILVYWNLKTRRSLLRYCVMSMCLYGSMFFTSLQSSFTSLFGKSIFLVTPKTGTNITYRHALRANRYDLAFAGGLLGTTLTLSESALPCILLIVTGISSVYLSRMGNIKQTKEVA